MGYIVHGRRRAGSGWEASLWFRQSPMFLYEVEAGDVPEQVPIAAERRSLPKCCEYTFRAVVHN